MHDPGITIADRLDLLPVVQHSDLVTLLPASGDIHDAAAHDVARARESHRLTSRVAIPNWRGPFVDGMDARLHSGCNVAVINADRIGLRGPLVLDLPVTFLSLRRRVRAITSPHRLDLVLGAHAGSPITSTIVRVESDLWLQIEDAVAAELVALTLRQFRVPDEVWTTPWEDELVQRAAEVDVGVRTPREIAVRLEGDTGDIRTHPFVMALALRTGIDIP